MTGLPKKCYHFACRQIQKFSKPFPLYPSPGRPPTDRSEVDPHLEIGSYEAALKVALERQKRDYEIDAFDLSPNILDGD